MSGPRSSSRSLGHGTRLALVCDALEDDFQSALVGAALAATAAHGVDLVVVPGGKLGDALGKNFVHAWVPMWADGIIVAAHTIDHLSTGDEMARFLERLRPVPTVTLGEVAGVACSLSIDNEQAAYDLMQHLLWDHRHERFAYLSGPATNIEARARQDGFLRALREAGLSMPPEHVLTGDFTFERGRAAIDELHHRRVDLRAVQALVCANDAMAAGACLELERRGYLIPRDLAVVGFDDTQLARHLPAPLTTVRQPLRELLFEAVRILVDALASGMPPEALLRYGATPVHRRSCGCARLPALPRPSTPVLGRDQGANLRALEPALRRDLDEAFVGVLDRSAPGWIGDLLEALGRQLEESGTAFYDALEALCFGLLRSREPIAGWHAALLVMRRHVARGEARPELLADLDRLVDGAMRLTSELATSYIARQREELLERLRVLSDATAGLLAAPDLGTIAAVARRSLPELGIARGMIHLFETDGDRPQLGRLAEFGLEPCVDTIDFPEDLRSDQRLAGRSWVIEPLGAGGRPLGLAVLECGLAQVSWYERLRDALTAAVNGAQLMTRVQKLVVTDPLTGVNNRRFLMQKIRQELEARHGRSEPLSLLVLDLDGFKLLNDERGHDEGDRALVEAAGWIRGCLTERDSLARYGGDEFVAVLPGATVEQAIAVARRVVDSLPPKLREKISATLTCSIGIATVDREQRAGDQELFRLADQALLAAKRGGKNRAVHARELLS